VKYYDNWSSRDDVQNDYRGENIPPEEAIVYAGYTYEDYSGSAIVVFVKDGVFYENNDERCSCDGLENWSPEETLPGALLMRQGWPGLHEAVEAAVKGLAAGEDPLARLEQIKKEVGL
jgi:hypothetical protein